MKVRSRSKSSAFFSVIVARRPAPLPTQTDTSLVVL